MKDLIHFTNLFKPPKNCTVKIGRPYICFMLFQSPFFRIISHDFGMS